MTVTPSALLSQRSPAEWRDWLDRLLLWSGSALLLAGILFFFAYNWADLSTTARFLVLQVGLAGTTLGALALGLDRLVGKTLLMASCVLVGVFLAVFGQTYQTGADAWLLFAGWGALILPWVLVSRSGACWTLLLLLADLALGLWGSQVAVPAGWLSAQVVAGLVGAQTLLALALRERALEGGASWFEAPWTRYLFLGLGLTVLTAPSVLFAHSLVDGGVGEALRDGAGSLLPPVLLIGALFLAFVRFRIQRPDMVALTLAVCSGAAVGYAGAMSLLFEFRLFGDIGEIALWLLLAAGITLGTGIGVGSILRSLSHSLREEDRR